MPKTSNAQPTDHRRRSLWPWLVAGLIVAASVVQLRVQGRIWWCACGEPFLWSGNIWTPHNSQHLVDPYSFTHVLHGMIFCGLLTWLCPRWPVGWRFVAALAVEAAWEVIENTEFIIGRYRASTASLDYLGDSVVNSLGDMASFAVGFVLARRVGLWPSVAIFFLTEILLVLWIRDSLLLNVIMLLYPIDALRAWQVG